MLKPIVAFFERKVPSRILSIFIAYLVAVIPLCGVLFFFFNQSRILFNDLPSVRGRLNEISASLFDWAGQKFNLDAESTSQWISDNIIAASDVPIKLIQESVQSTGYILANIGLVVVITYFMLLYRTAFKNFFLAQIKPKNRRRVIQVLEEIQMLAKRYLIGQGLVILILGLLIGTGLWLIGVPYPYFWGFLAGFLEIIPYVGTSIGGILPFFYMLMVSDNLWQPVGVVVLYIAVQQIEGNIISPNVMGPSIKINPFFIILGLFVGGIIWGIAGMILALPILAISKEIFRSFKLTEPLSYLLEDGLSRKKGVFLSQFDEDKYRLFNLFFEERKK
ncbi:AI-2E family transporter [Flavobacteriaceae bacterium R33]|uniref:AI-2E family transporter n=2 Tax=Poritiphilus flavus TaxID=2697053 RepID=A0A6L9EG76_9FLAO|nr:AI-2E family transporter [Poritiphilus flavus]